MQMVELVNPLNLPVLDATRYTTGQDSWDEAHVEEIAQGMRRDGWVGAPLVVLSDYARAYCGTHRLLAAGRVGLETVPGVELADLFEAHSLDLWQIAEQEGLSVLMDRAVILAHLPADALADYGLDDIEP